MSKSKTNKQQKKTTERKEERKEERRKEEALSEVLWSRQGVKFVIVHLFRICPYGMKSKGKDYKDLRKPWKLLFI